MTTGAATRFAFGLGLLGTGAAGASLVVGITTGAAGAVPLLFAVLFALIGSLGLLVVLHAPRNAVGWLLLALAVLSCLSTLLESLAAAAPAHAVAIVDRTVTAVVVEPVSPLLLVLALLLFPTGHVPAPRWRWVTRGLVATTVAGVLAAVLGATGVAGALGNLVILGGIMAAATSLVLRHRRGDVVERAQIRWVRFAVMVLVLVLLSGNVVAALLGASEEDVPEVLQAGVFAVALLGVPVAMTIAIRRHGLFEIDRLVSRTLGWAAVTVVLGAVYAGLTLLAASLAGGGRDVPDLGIAMATLVTAALFRPVHDRLQHALDRRFARVRLDRVALVESFAQRLRDELEVGSLDRELRQAATVAFAPSRATVWLHPGRTVP